jgi:uncharacterized FAD-dependent dehydrogenase
LTIHKSTGFYSKGHCESTVQPTLSDAVAGDITAAMPYRTMINIINFIEALDIVVPGFASAMGVMMGRIL